MAVRVRQADENGAVARRFPAGVTTVRRFLYPHMLRHAFAIHQLTAMIQRLLADPAWATSGPVRQFLHLREA
ncbi:hypothetical protein XB02_01595 [Pantoea ananatis]|nr:hypothetical protein XB02_01595 [Pantoea ananatis]